MKILVTGGTGFVGSHSVRALLQAAHQVRLLVRNRAKASVQGVELADGDVTDRAAVERAVAGCDAVLHAASVYSYRRSMYAEMRRINVAGTRIVLEAGIAAGCNPVVHVSSVVALLGGTPRGGTLGAESPIGAPFGVYMGTKRDSEVVARDLQARGHPVVTTYPGSVWGPDDPYLGESSTTAMQMARGLVPFTTLGRMQVVDVRDVAAVHAQAMKRHDAPKRFTALGHAVSHADVQRMVCAAAGVKRLNIPTPASLVVTAIPLFWLVARAGIHWAESPDGAWLTWRDNGTDDSATGRELGVTFRPAQESIRDTVAWLKASGQLKV